MSEKTQKTTGVTALTVTEVFFQTILINVLLRPVTELLNKSFNNNPHV